MGPTYGADAAAYSFGGAPPLEALGFPGRVYVPNATSFWCATEDIAVALGLDTKPLALLVISGGFFGVVQKKRRFSSKINPSDQYASKARAPLFSFFLLMKAPSRKKGRSKNGRMICFFKTAAFCFLSS